MRSLRSATRMLRVRPHAPPPSATWRSAPAGLPTGCASGFSTTGAGACSPSAIGSPTRKARARRRLVLRPARLRSPAGELRGDREGRRPAASLVPSRTSGDQHRRPGDADVLGRHHVRVPDAAAGDAELPRNPPRSELSGEYPPADRVRPGAPGSMGSVGVGVLGRRSRGNLSVQSLRRPRSRTEARPGRGTRDRAVRDRSGQPCRSGRGSRQPRPHRALRR